MTNAVLTRGFSTAAQYIADVTDADRQSLNMSAAVGFEQIVHGELADVWEECRQPNWDGYNALPVTWDARQSMCMFLEALPIGFPRPTIGADPHGHLTAEWYVHPRRVLSVEVTADGLLHYAALLGSNKTCGSEAFFGDVPKNILDLVRRVYS